MTSSSLLSRNLTGFFTKYNDNDGEVYATNNVQFFLAAEAFSHFTLVESNGAMLVCDLQGINDFYTDPQIHTAQEESVLGMGNRGLDGTARWVAKRQCNDMCRAKGLHPLTSEGIPLPFCCFGSA